MDYLFLLILHIGYLRDPNDKEHLIVDKKAEKVIKRIFKDYLDGINCHCIARRLNDENIPTRIEHMKKVGVNIGKNKKPRIIKYKVEIGDTLKSIAERYKVSPMQIMQLNNVLENIKNIDNTKILEEQELVDGQILTIPKKIIWDDTMIRNVLNNEMYTGYLVFGKTENKSYKDSTKIRLSKENWIRVPNCHEAIIERRIWLQAQEKLEKNTHNERTIPKNLFAKKLYCECCGRGLQKEKMIRNNDYYLGCKTVNKIGRFCDNRKTIKKSELEKIILDKINEQLNKYYDIDKVAVKYDEILYNDKKKEFEKLKLKLNNIEYALSEKTDRLNLLYEDRMNGILSIEEFKILKENLDSEMLNLSNNKNELSMKIKEFQNEKDRNEFKKNELFEKYVHIDTLTVNILSEFVRKIIIGKYNEVTNSRNIKIIWNTDKKEEIV